MSVETSINTSGTNKVRRGPADHLRQAIVSLTAGHAQIRAHSESAWASVTFTGSRHIIKLTFEGLPAAKAGEEFIAALPDYEFNIPGQIVADALIKSVDHTMLPDVRLEVVAELLLLVDA